MKKEMSNKRLVHSVCLEYLGFRDRDVEDVLIPDFGERLLKKYGISAVYTGSGNITPDAYVNRLMNGTQMIPAAYWKDVPPSQELYFELDYPISKEVMEEFIVYLYGYWGGKLKPLQEVRYVSGVEYGEDNYEADDSLEYFVYIKDVIEGLELK